MLLKSFFTLFFITGLYFSSLQAQQANLNVSFSKYVLDLGDTVNIDFDLQSQNKIYNKATVNCVIKNNVGFEKKLRWPLLNEKGVVQLVIDKNLPKGVYDFVFFVQEGIFKINGKVVVPSKQKTLKAALINNKGQVNLEELNVDAENNFVIKNYIFEDYANLIFSDQKGKQKKLDIRIDAFLDSVYNPIAVASNRVKIGNEDSRNFSTILNLSRKDSMLYTSKINAEAVVVYGIRKKTEEYYEENYVGGFFKDIDSKVFSLIDDPMAQSSTDVIQYIQNKIPNLSITYNQLGEASVKFRNAAVQFYLDEIPIDLNFIQSISVADIALVKFFNQFIGNIGGNGGAVAIYTRRGGDVISKPTGDFRFRVKGYTPALAFLSSDN